MYILSCILNGQKWLPKAKQAKLKLSILIYEIHGNAVAPISPLIFVISCLLKLGQIIIFFIENN